MSVHLLKVTSTSETTTKCGVTARPNKIEVTGWASEVTCSACLELMAVKVTMPELDKTQTQGE